MKQLAIGALMTYAVMSQQFNNVVVGDGNNVQGDQNTLLGDQNTQIGDESLIQGDQITNIGNGQIITTTSFNSGVTQSNVGVVNTQNIPLQQQQQSISIQQQQQRVPLQQQTNMGVGLGVNQQRVDQRQVLNCDPITKKPLNLRGDDRRDDWREGARDFRDDRRGNFDDRGSIGSFSGDLSGGVSQTNQLINGGLLGVHQTNQFGVGQRESSFGLGQRIDEPLRIDPRGQSVIGGRGSLNGLGGGLGLDARFPQDGNINMWGPGSVGGVRDFSNQGGVGFRDFDVRDHSMRGGFDLRVPQDGPINMRGPGSINDLSFRGNSNIGIRGQDYGYDNQFGSHLNKIQDNIIGSWKRY